MSDVLSLAAIGDRIRPWGRCPGNATHMIEARGRIMKIEIEREEDGRWVAEVPDLPGVMTYGTTRMDAVAKAEALALRVLADRLDHGEEIPDIARLFAVSA